MTHCFWSRNPDLCSENLLCIGWTVRPDPCLSASPTSNTVHKNDERQSLPGVPHTSRVLATGNDIMDSEGEKTLSWWFARLTCFTSTRNRLKFVFWLFCAQLSVLYIVTRDAKLLLLLLSMRLAVVGSK